MNCCRLCLALAISLICASPVLAQTGSSGKVAERSEAEHVARKACMVGNFAKGVDILADLFLATGDAVYIYNQGRCFQQNHQWQEASDRFAEYLRKAKGISEAERAEAQSHITECEEHLSKAVAAPSEPAPQPVVMVPVTSPPPPAPAPAPTEDRGFGLRVAGIVVGAAGLAGIGTGIFCSAKTYDLRDDASQLDSYKTAGTVAYAAGGVALATGIVLYLIGHSKKGDAAPSVIALVPAVGPEQTSLLLSGTF
jgi:hypothetical protein